MGSRRLTRAQYRRSGDVQSLASHDSKCRPSNDQGLELKSEDFSLEARPTSKENPQPADPQAHPRGSQAGSGHSIEEVPDILSDSKSVHLAQIMKCPLPVPLNSNTSASSNSVNQHEKSNSSAPPEPQRVMLSRLSMGSPSPAAENSRWLSTSNGEPFVLPARVMMCPVRRRSERPILTKSIQAGTALGDSAPSCSSSIPNHGVLCSSSPSPASVSHTSSLSSSTSSTCFVEILPSKECSNSSEDTSSKDDPSGLKCRSGRSSYSLRALKSVPLYYENNSIVIPTAEPKKMVKREVVEANNNINNQISSLPIEEEASYINQLPDEILCMIFSYIPHLELLRSCALVCHRWSSLSKCPSLRQVLTFRGQDIPIEIICGLIKSSPLLKSISVKDRNDVEGILPILHQQCKRLEAVNLVRCRPSDGSHRNLRAKSLYPLLRKGQLRSLNLKGTDYKSRKFYQMLGTMSNLRKLDISCSKSITPQILSEIAKHTTLRVFKNKWHSHSVYYGPKSMMIQLPGKIDEWASAYNLLFQNVGENLTTLEFYAAGINDAALSGLSNCKKLKKLSVYNANLFGAESMAAVGSLPGLHELLIHNAKLSTDNVVGAFKTGNLSALKCLHMNDSILSAVPSGANISADSCLEVIAGKCSQLQHLSFTKCREVTDEGVRSVLTNCSQLLSLDLNGGHGIAGQSFLLIPSSTPHLKLLVIGGICSDEKNTILKTLIEKHGINVRTSSTWMQIEEREL